MYSLEVNNGALLSRRGGKLLKNYKRRALVLKECSDETFSFLKGK